MHKPYSVCRKLEILSSIKVIIQSKNEPISTREFFLYTLLGRADRNGIPVHEETNDPLNFVVVWRVENFSNFE